MFTRILPAAVLLVLPLAGCVEITPSRPALPDLSSCTSNATHRLVGSPISLVNTSALASTVRILPPNGIATMDFNPKRTNVYIDEASRIVRITCG